MGTLGSIRRHSLLVGILALCVCVSSVGAQTSTPQLIASFYGPMPTGVTVSKTGRIFTNFPRWTDRDPTVTVAEVTSGSTYRAYPNAELNRFDPERPADTFVSVQSVVLDPLDRLWILDTGSINFEPTLPGGPKLVAVDLATNTLVKTIFFPRDVALPTTYLNDIRFDLRRGTGGMAFITDSGEKSPNGIIVVDLATGESWRRLDNHPSVKAVPNFVPTVEGQPLLVRKPGEPPQTIKTGSDGIAISADGERLFYTPLASRRLYSVSVDALVDRSLSHAQVATTVVDEGEKPGGSDGLESDAQGRVYATDYEHAAVHRRAANGEYTTIANVKPFEWPDTLSVGADGYLYIMANQLHRQPNYQNGQDLRQRPYNLYRVKIDGTPVQLK